MAAQAIRERDDNWEMARNAANGYGDFGDITYPGNFGPAYEYGANTESSPAHHGRDPLPLTEFETIEVFRSAVDNARELVYKQGENEKIDAAVQPNLTLDLKRKGIEHLPDQVIQIMKRDVERIVLSHNIISQLPGCFHECTTMQYLNLKGNRFTEFPRALLRMEKLQILDLSRNNMDHLPEEINNMKALRVFSVMHNRLSDLPLALGNLDSLRMLKMGGNPLNEQLKAIVDSSESATSPLTTPIAENEKDALLTLKIKLYLRNEISASESGGESSGESPLETPKPLKRNTSHRFPVVPAAASETSSDSRSPSISKPPVPNRSHYRVVSTQSNSSHGTSFRRPSVSPLILGNERNRSNSENVLQATQNSRNKRMGMVPRKMGLSPLEESSANRNSLHLRGTSHGSALRDRRAQGSIQPGSSNPPELGEYLQQSGTFIRQLSSVPEQKQHVASPNMVIEGAKGLLFSLHALHPYISSLLPLAGDDGSKRSSLERVFYNSSTHLDSLDHELYLCQSMQGDDRQQKRALRTIRRACRACIVAYIQVGRLLMKNGRQLLSRGDPRYIRMLLLLFNGSNVEATNALGNFNSTNGTAIKAAQFRHPPNLIREDVPKLTVRAMTPTQERPPTTRRLRSGTANFSRSNQAAVQGHNKSATHPQSAVPLYINGRSRSNSRSNAINLSATNSIASTPISGESFLIPETPTLTTSHAGNPVNTEANDAAFEKIYQNLQKLVKQASSALPMVCSVFGRCLESAQNKLDGRKHVEMWTRLHTRSRQTMDLCEKLTFNLTNLKLDDLEVRQSIDFWNQVTRFTNAFVSLCDEVKGVTATNREQMVALDIPRLLKPVHKSVRATIQSLTDSPWAFVLSSNGSGQGHQPQWQPTGYQNGLPAPRMNGHHRSRGDSASSSSPFMPTTPLSAALGPAAQATIPTASSAASAFDRSFQGDVFQRAEFTLQQNPVLHQRRM